MVLSLLRSATLQQPGSLLGSNAHTRIPLGVLPLDEDSVIRLHLLSLAHRAICKHILLDNPWEALWAPLLVVEGPNPRKILPADEAGESCRYPACRLPKRSCEGF